MLNKKTIQEYALISVGTAIIAAAVYFFMIPGNLTPGSAAAVALLLSNVIPLPVSAITFILNALLLIIGFLLIGKEFGAKTVYASLLVPAVMWVYEQLFPNFQSLTNDPLLDVICYILVSAVGLAMLFSCNASSGGLDIVAKLMNKYLRIELGKAMSLSGMLVALCSVFVYDKTTVVLSLLGTYFGGLLIDNFIFSLNIKRRVCIISPKLEEITQFILHDLHSGATLNEIIGAYDNQSRREVITIVNNSEYRKLMEFVKKTDPTAFVTVYSVNAISYQPKKR